MYTSFGPVAPAASASGEPGARLAPIMSTLISATIRSSGTGGRWTKKRVPQRPRSSPLSQRKMTERFGRGPAASASAIASVPALPEALSSAAL